MDLTKQLIEKLKMENWEIEFSKLTTQDLEKLGITKTQIEILKEHIIKLNQKSEYFEIGRIVRITDGPFSNMKGIIECINNNNVVISLMIFEKETRIEIGKESLEIIDKE